MRNGKDKHWTTFRESCEQPIRSKELQEAVDRSCLELQTTLPQSQFCDVQCDAVMTSASHQRRRL